MCLFFIDCSQSVGSEQCCFVNLLSIRAFEFVAFTIPNLVSARIQLQPSGPLCFAFVIANGIVLVGVGARGEKLISNFNFLPVP